MHTKVCTTGFSQYLTFSYYLTLSREELEDDYEYEHNDHHPPPPPKRPSTSSGYEYIKGKTSCVPIVCFYIQNLTQFTQ